MKRKKIESCAGKVREIARKKESKKICMRKKLMRKKSRLLKYLSHFE